LSQIRHCQTRRQCRSPREMILVDAVLKPEANRGLELNWPCV
jgi:hypothetical protein